MKHTTCYTTILGTFAIVITATWAVQDAQAAETWTASLTATSNDPLAQTILLQFGVAPSATDGFDIGLDLPAPPAPPSGIKLNAYFLCSHQFVKQLKTEIRKSVDTVNWQLSVRADSDGFALNWDISNIPAALSVMMGIGEESIDMRKLSSRSFSSGTYTLTITVGMNGPPVVSDIPNVGFPEDGYNSSIDLDGYVTDPDNTDVQIDWTHAGNTNVDVSIDSVTHVVTFTATLNWYGSETITFTATDPGGLSDSDSMTVTVSAVNDPPVVSDIPNVGFPEDGSNSSIDLDGYVTDPDNTDAQIDWTHAGNTNVDVSIDSVTHVVTFTATLNWYGSETVIFTASDPGNLSDSDSMTITVSAVNDPPVVSDIPDVGFPEDGSNSSIDLDGYVTDPDNTDAQITWAYAGHTNVNVSIDSISHVVTFTSTLNWHGSESITFTATDPGNLSDSDSMTVTVSAVNDPPVVSNIPNVGFPEDGSNSSIDLDGYVTDPDNTDAQIDWTHAGNTNVNVSIDSVTHVVTFTATLNWHGSETITFTATDPGNLSDSDSMTVTVSAVNDPPLVSNIPDVSFVENGGDSSIDLDDYVTDPDNTDTEITWIYADNTNVNVFIDPITHVVTFTATFNWHGSETVPFTASDPVGLSDSDSMTISVFTASDTDVSLIVQTSCPVDLVVTDPGDRVTSRDSSAIPSAIYIEMDLDGDGDLDDRVFVSDPLVGDYSIEVIPVGADPLDTYTLDVIYGNESVRLAEDLSIHEIPVQPYIFFFPCCKMKAGWNLISLPLRPLNLYPGAVLATIDGKYDSVWAYDPDEGWSVYAPEINGDLEEMKPGRGYWIKMDQPGVLILQGTDPEETGIFLEGGKWNLVGYTSRKARSPEDCMGSAANAIDLIWECNPGMGWSIYSPGDYSDLQLMKPARGYWIKADQSCMWIY